MGIGQVSEKLNIKAYTLRYYESIGLIQDVKRDAAGKRQYTDQDVKWIAMLKRLRATGMSIEKMKAYAKLRYIGDETAAERKKMMKEHLRSIEEEIDKLSDTRDYVLKKIKIYEEMESKIIDQGK